MLADALHHARSTGATHIVDFATLTGAMSVALGDLYRGLVLQRRDVRRADRARRRSRAATSAARFPLHRRYRRYIDSTFADMKNASELREGGARPGRDVPAGVRRRGPVGARRHGRPRRTSSASVPDYMLDEGGTGYGVRLIVELAQAFASA